MIKQKKHYILSPDKTRNWAVAWESGGEFDPMCKKCERTIERRPGGARLPLVYKVPPGKPHGDVWFHAQEFLVNERAMSAILKHVSDGISFVKARITSPAGLYLWSMEVSNRCVMHADCNVQLVEVCQECGDQRYSTWDGGIRIAPCTHDMFRLIEFSGMIFVSESLKQALEGENLKNSTFVDADSIHDEFAWMRPKRRE